MKRKKDLDSKIVEWETFSQVSKYHGFVSVHNPIEFRELEALPVILPSFLMCLKFAEEQPRTLRPSIYADPIHTMCQLLSWTDWIV